LVCAQEAHWQVGLDVVVFVPVRVAPHRTIDQDPGPEVRFTMCEHATSADGRFAVSRIEIDRDGPSYTVDTLRELRRTRPDDELFLILGGDQASALPEWHEPDEVLSLASVAVAERGEEHRRDVVAERIASVRDDARVVFFDMPRLDVSSTLIRSRAAGGKPIRYLVPDKVANYIGAQSLYGAAAPAGVA
jgi:nicotinate-nucleotide adenylyltransferase